MFGFAWTDVTSTSASGVCFALLGWFGKDLNFAALVGFLEGRGSLLGTATAGLLDGFAIIFIV